MGQMTAAAIVARTFTKGHGLDDQPHKPHSQISTKKSYGAYSYSWGRVRAGLAKHPTIADPGVRETNRVTLMYSGTMMGQLQLLSWTEDSAVVGIEGNSGQYAGYVHKLRPFLGISPADRKAIEQQVHDLFLKMYMAGR